MSPLPEIDEAVKFIRKKDIPFALLQCTSMYPTPPEKVGLNVIPFFQERYHCPVGLSDHSGKIYPALAAATLRAAVIEVHVTFHQKIFGPDVPASVTTEELRQLVEGVRFIEKARSYPVDKDEIAYELAEMRQLFTKSVVARTDLTSGTILQTEHLTVKKPGTGIPAAHLSQIIGRQLAHPLKKDEFLTEEDLA
jgi:N-acetylneuraminate synthase